MHTSLFAPSGFHNGQFQRANEGHMKFNIVQLDVKAPQVAIKEGHIPKNLIEDYSMFKKVFAAVMLCEDSSQWSSAVNLTWGSEIESLSFFMNPAEGKHGSLSVLKGKYQKYYSKH